MAKTIEKDNSSFVRQETSQNNGSTCGGTQERQTSTAHLPPGKGLARNKTEAAGYIAEMLPVLCNMAQEVDLKFLNYLLEMAYEESVYCCNETPEPDRS